MYFILRTFAAANRKILNAVLSFYVHNMNKEHQDASRFKFIYKTPSKGTVTKTMKKTKPKIYAVDDSWKRKDRTITISYRDLRSIYKPDRFCLNLWNMTMPDWIPENLRADMVDSLRGFDEDMALEIADNLIDCWTGLGLRTTGIKHVDELLGKLYMRILSCAHEKGIKLAAGK